MSRYENATRATTTRIRETTELVICRIMLILIMKYKNKTFYFNTHPLYYLMKGYNNKV